MKEIYSVNLETIQNSQEFIISLLVFVILFGLSFILRKHYKDVKFFRSFVYVLLFLVVFKILMTYIEQRSIKNALQNDEKVFVTCGKIKKYEHFTGSREHFEIGDIFFSLDIDAIKSNYQSYDMLQEKYFRADYIMILGSKELIRLFEVENCRY